MRYIVFLMLIAVGFQSCIKKGCALTQNTSSAPQAEQDELQDYITRNNITAVKDPTGYFYSIITPGDNNKPTLCSNLSVSYTGWLTNGTIFDSGSTSFQLNTLIEGWKRALPKIGVGGKIKMYLPPTFAYGSRGVGSIPPNSILVFEVELREIF
ncbi:MAG: FKBP-type peptidyl-prolyl cis-trans isomerase [Chitinophagaceae bacterium]